jgi:Ca2+-binding EF-hand superfamily protein
VLEPSFDSEGTQRVNSFSEEERRARFEEAFFEMDESGGGTLDMDEVRSALEVLTKQPHTNEDARNFINMVDKDGSGEIDLEEFVEGMEAMVVEAMVDGEDVEHEDDDDSDLDELDKGIDDLENELGPSVTS